ncbi:MAG: FtsQ-type POTRA domain-containing protein [Sphaerochaetaceae bacterium]|nr:FtsQ-type POTRA domain-containing protein [Sphaerochaetaceae bacterium]MDC7249773.1 FtsQ-type POTRA domain-containing protein [Sphaerochaetaceae bacterium]
MTKKNKVIMISLIIMMGIFSIFIILFNSSNLNLEKIEISIDEGEVPPSVISYAKKYENINIFKINLEEIRNTIEENPFVDSAKVKITLSKNLRISLKKVKVNAIIYEIENKSYAILSDEGIFSVDNEDKSLIDNHLVIIEMQQNVLNALLKQKDFNKFNNLVANLDILNDFSYLISRVKYDNNVNNSFGFFKLELENTNTVIRVREQVDSHLLIKAIEFAQKNDFNKESQTVLDVYHGAIIERNLPLGG